MKKSIERKYLESITKSVMLSINNLDDLMQQPSTVERGRAIAKVINDLELANDCARHFGLGQVLKSRAKKSKVSA